MHIILLFKGNNILLPELFSVTWTPSKLSTFNLAFKFIYGAEFSLVFIEVLEKRFKHFVNVFVNPVSILKFNNKLKGINISQMFLANFIFFNVVVKLKKNSCNLFPAVEIKHFCAFFNKT